MTSVENYADVERLLVHVSRLTAFDESRCQLQVRFDAIVTGVRTAHASGEPSDQIARLRGLRASIQAIDELALAEIEQFGITVSEVIDHGQT